MTTAITDAVYSHVELPGRIPVSAATATSLVASMPLAQAASSGPTAAIPLDAVWNVAGQTHIAEAKIWREPRPRETLVAFDGLRVALHARIHEGDGLVVIEDSVTGIFGSGDTLAKAILDLRAALAEHLEVLSDDDSLSLDLRRQLESLRSYFDTP